MFLKIVRELEVVQFCSVQEHSGTKNQPNGSQLLRKKTLTTAALINMDGINSYNQFVLIHKPQLISCQVPEFYWKTLHRKLLDSDFDAGETFSLFLIDYGEEEREDHEPVWTVQVTREDGIDIANPTDIFLIDHAWTFRMNNMRQDLLRYHQLIGRLCTIMGINSESEDSVELILKCIWRYCQSYSFHNRPVEDALPIWYVMDELGCAINHSDDPNFRLVPFLYIPEGVTYSILFPIKKFNVGENVTRNFVEGIHDETYRKGLLLPWIYSDFKSISFKQTEPTEDYFREGHIPETLPSLEQKEPEIDFSRPLKVYTEYDVIKEHLTDPSFEVVDTDDDADILWLTTHFKDFYKLSRDCPNKFINQFPFEYIITVKDLLSIVCRRCSKPCSSSDDLESNPKWIPTTYNLKNELTMFISYFQNRSDSNLDNNWIIKPFNLARGLDTTITDNVSQIIRLSQTGPKIAQKYIENPVLFYRNDIDSNVKFDVRYVVLLKSIKPLEAYIYKNAFLRFANKAFDLSNFDDYEKHYTVMNYADNVDLYHLQFSQFLMKWNEQYSNYDWEIIENDICDLLKNLLLAASKKDPPCGISASHQSRALYAADIMLSWDEKNMQPKLLEINWIPDCKRACDYYPDFFNNIFQLLFLNNYNEKVFKKIIS